MPSEMLDSLQQLVNLKRGLFIVSASKGNGESTLFNMTVTAGDRLMRDFISIEEKNESPSEVQNVKVQKYDTEAGGSPNQAVEKAMLSYPSGFVTRDLSDPSFASELVKRAMEDKMVIVSVQAQDSIGCYRKDSRIRHFTGRSREMPCWFCFAKVGAQVMCKVCKRTRNALAASWRNLRNQ